VINLNVAGSFIILVVIFVFAALQILGGTLGQDGAADQNDQSDFDKS
jgi:hypothetical protein